MSSPRANRVPGRIKEILAELVPTLKDPRIGFVTITDVRMTPDFSKATVFYTVLGAQSGADVVQSPSGPRTHPPSKVLQDDDTRPGNDPVEGGEDEAAVLAEQRTSEGLASATPLLRRELGSRMRLRQVPALEFVLDPVPAQGRRIEALLDEARTQQ